MTSLPATDWHIYNLKKQKQSFERLLLLLVFISLYTVWIQSAALTLRQLTGQPVQTLVQTGTLSGTGGLDMPLMRQKGNTVRKLGRWVLMIIIWADPDKNVTDNFMLELSTYVFIRSDIFINVFVYNCLSFARSQGAAADPSSFTHLEWPHASDSKQLYCLYIF